MNKQEPKDQRFQEKLQESRKPEKIDLAIIKLKTSSPIQQLLPLKTKDKYFYLEFLLQKNHYPAHPL